MIGVHVDLQTKNVVKIELFDHESSPYSLRYFVCF